MTSRVFDSASKFLPTTEDRALHRLKSAFVSLKAYASLGDESYKEKAVKDFRKVADVFDTWDWGNLKFIREGVGNAIAEFRKNFRGRFVPAVKNANRTSVESFFLWLTGTVNVLEMGQLSQRHFEAWNAWLTDRAPDMQELFPYHKPSSSLLSRLRARRLHLTFLSMALLGPSLTYTVVVGVTLASHDAGLYAAIAVLGLVVTLYVGIVGTETTQERLRKEQH